MSFVPTSMKIWLDTHRSRSPYRGDFPKQLTALNNPIDSDQRSGDNSLSTVSATQRHERLEVRRLLRRPTSAARRHEALTHVVSLCKHIVVYKARTVKRISAGRCRSQSGQQSYEGKTIPRQLRLFEHLRSIKSW
jgi:hypothetical protein